MLDIAIEYLNTTYILPLIAVLIGLLILYIYDLFEKKQYNNAVYFRVGILIYISSFITIYISRTFFINFNLQHNTQHGGNSQTFSHQSGLQQPNEIRNAFEHFKTGVPTF